MSTDQSAEPAVRADEWRIRVTGVVQGVGWGVLDQDRINLPRSVPYVQRSLDWATKPNRWLPQPGWAAPPWMIPTPGFLATGSGRS